MVTRFYSGTSEMWEKKKDLVSQSSKIINLNMFHVLVCCKKLETSWFETSWFWGLLQDFVTSWFCGLAWKQYFASFLFRDLVNSLYLLCASLQQFRNFSEIMRSRRKATLLKGYLEITILADRFRIGISIHI